MHRYGSRDALTFLVTDRRLFIPLFSLCPFAKNSSTVFHLSPRGRIKRTMANPLLSCNDSFLFPFLSLSLFHRLRISSARWPLETNFDRVVCTFLTSGECVFTAFSANIRWILLGTEYSRNVRIYIGITL